MSKTYKYLKLSAKTSLFYCPRSRLKVTKATPGKVLGNLSKKANTALTNGHLLEITEEVYDEMMGTHQGNVEAQLKVSEEKFALRKKAEKLAGKRAEPKKGSDDDDSDDDDDDDSDDEKKSLKKMNRADLLIEVEDLEDITEDKIEEVMEGNKKEIIEFIEKYNSDDDSDVEGDDDSDDDDSDDDDSDDE